MVRGEPERPVTELPVLQPPAGLLEVADGLEAGGYQAWAVGGAIRDALLGRSRADWDLATDALPEEVRALFPRTVPLGLEHGTVGVLAEDGTMYEVTTFRLDVETDGRHAVVEFAATIEEDLARRDFTINSMAWRPSTEELRDPFGGSADLQNRVLRAVGDPWRRFTEDYLRVLRAFRFAGLLELEIETETRAALAGSVEHLPRLSAERVREELLKVIASPAPSAALDLYADYGALEGWYRELGPAVEGPSWTETLAAVDSVPAHRSFLRVVRLLLAAGAGGGGDPEAAEAILRRLKFSNAEIRRGTRLVEHYLPLVHPADGSATLRKWLHSVGPDQARDLFRLHFAAVRASGSVEGQRALLFTWQRVHDELVQAAPVTLSQLAVDGSDLLELGLPRGPLVGVMLEELLEQVIESPERNERETLLGSARELIELGGLDSLDSPESDGPE